MNETKPRTFENVCGPVFDADTGSWRRRRCNRGLLVRLQRFRWKTDRRSRRGPQWVGYGKSEGNTTSSSGGQNSWRSRRQKNKRSVYFIQRTGLASGIHENAKIRRTSSFSCRARPEACPARKLFFFSVPHAHTFRVWGLTISTIARLTVTLFKRSMFESHVVIED